MLKVGGWTFYPAIVLRRGRVVRLRQGDPDRETAYADDPARVGERWREAGAGWLHVVNLDGAFGERGNENRKALETILAVGARVQFGGGLRRMADVRQILDLGVRRVVLGTAAVKDPALVEAVLAAFGPERVAVGIDARRGQVQTHGWQEAAAVTPRQLARQWAGRGVRWVVFTDVARDGMGSGLNLEATVELARETGLNIIASGGVASLDDVRATYRAGLSGVIIGRALYEGHVSLREALQVGHPHEKEKK
ncbi:MAG TPA: 1-(5-phosphoribosyl)-5-[(5-phosphoribosylamino)methylideneamino]imidazole-4-carboxamide isomerase [Chloroflexi bacterium]|nr:1-(5-phosphoribosyl)-5-[(5-phosphoribosylamino)methylideneamino]imidazole-4-carboxamide isomerase [Chloroflexota bacterium]